MLKPWKAGALGVCHPLGTDRETEAQREEAAHSHTASGKVKTGPQAPRLPVLCCPPALRTTSLLPRMMVTFVQGDPVSTKRQEGFCQLTNSS